MPLSTAQKRWNRENPERLRAYKRNWDAKNADNIQVKARERYANRTPEMKARDRAYAQAWHEKRRGNGPEWVKKKLTSTKCHARRKNVPFAVTAQDIEAPTHCPVLGVPLIYGAKRRDECAATLDRIVPAFGYVVGNVRVISALANSCRQDCLNAVVFGALAADARRLFGG